MFTAQDVMRLRAQTNAGNKIMTQMILFIMRLFCIGIFFPLLCPQFQPLHNVFVSREQRELAMPRRENVME